MKVSRICHNRICKFPVSLICSYYNLIYFYSYVSHCKAVKIILVYKNYNLKHNFIKSTITAFHKDYL